MFSGLQRHARKRGGPVFEVLESRTLLSAAPSLWPYLTVRVPAVVVAGAESRGHARLDIINFGEGRVDAGLRLEVDLLARPIGGGGDVLLEKIDELVGGMRSGSRRRFSMGVTLPATLPTGTYNLVAELDPANVAGSVVGGGSSIGKVNLNTTTYVSIVVAGPDVDLVGEVAPKAKVPLWLLSGYKSQVKLPVMVQNDGGVATADRQPITVDMVARSSADQSEVDLGTVTMNAGRLKPGQSRKVRVKTTVPAGLSGDYQLVAKIDSGDAIAEHDETNNEAATAAIRLVSDWTQITPLPRPTGYWRYDTHLSGNVTGFGSAGETDVSLASAGSGGNLTLTRTITDHRGRKLTSTETLDSTHKLLSDRQSLPSGEVDSFTYSQWQSTPGGDGDSEVATADVGVAIQLSNGAGHLTGTKTSHLMFEGYQVVRPESWVFTAAKFVEVIDTTLSGEMSYVVNGVSHSVDIRWTIHEVDTYFVVPQDGTVESISHQSERTTIRRNGAGNQPTRSQTSSTSIKEELIGGG